MMFTDRERRLLAGLVFFLALGYLLSALRAAGVYSADRLCSMTADSLSCPADQPGDMEQESRPVTSVLRAPEASHFRDGYLDLNLADSLELIRLPGIGPALAGRILEVRRREGRFVNILALRQVKGIGEKRLSDLRGYLTVQDGDSFHYSSLPSQP
jgi:DNA uptake protein ComE-like DNA-binding protein